SVESIEQAVERYTKKGAAQYAEHEKEQIRAMDEPQRQYIPTGFPALDTIIGGWSRGDLHIIGARPGAGKTAMCLSSADEVATAGHPVLLMSMELGEKAAQGRIVARRENIPLEGILRGSMTPDEISRRHSGLAKAKELPLWI